MRRAWPFLLLLAAPLTGGCIYIPGPQVSERSHRAGPTVNPNRVVGDPGSSKPIRPGVDRQAVRSLLGRPDKANDDASLEDYHFHLSSGRFFCLVPLGHLWGDLGVGIEDDLNLRLRFDARDRVASWSIAKGYGPPVPGMRWVDTWVDPPWTDPPPATAPSPAPIAPEPR